MPIASHADASRRILKSLINDCDHMLQMINAPPSAVSAALSSSTTVATPNSPSPSKSSITESRKQMQYGYVPTRKSNDSEQSTSSSLSSTASSDSKRASDTTPTEDDNDADELRPTDVYELAPSGASSGAVVVDADLVDDESSSSLASSLRQRDSGGNDDRQQRTTSPSPSQHQSQPQQQPQQQQQPQSTTTTTTSDDAQRHYGLAPRAKPMLRKTEHQTSLAGPSCLSSTRIDSVSVFSFRRFLFLNFDAVTFICRAYVHVSNRFPAQVRGVRFVEAAAPTSTTTSNAEIVERSAEARAGTNDARSHRCCRHQRLTCWV